MTGSDGWTSSEQSVWQSPVGLQLVVECLLREPPFADYVKKMAPLPHLNAVGNCGFLEPNGGFIPSAHIHDDPRDPDVYQTYQRRARRFMALMEDSDYCTLFLYTLRLRDLSQPKHFVNIARRLPEEVARFSSLLEKRWPGFRWRLLIPVLGELPEGVPPKALEALEACIQRMRSVNDSSAEPCIVVERLGDAPRGPEAMDGSSAKRTLRRHASPTPERAAARSPPTKKASSRSSLAVSRDKKLQGDHQVDQERLQPYDPTMAEQTWPTIEELEAQSKDLASKPRPRRAGGAKIPAPGSAVAEPGGDAEMGEGDAEEAEGNMADDDDDGEGRLGSTLQFVVCFGSEFPVSDS
eukprot:s1734_g2.t1